jgi:hypothetical protein
MQKSRTAPQGVFWGVLFGAFAACTVSFGMACSPVIPIYISGMSELNPKCNRSSQKSGANNKFYEKYAIL